MSQPQPNSDVTLEELMLLLGRKEIEILALRKQIGLLQLQVLHTESDKESHQ